MIPDRWNRLSAWHNAWLAADADQRRQLRDQFVAENADLAADADTLAAASANLQGFLETPAFVLAAHALAQDDPVLTADTLVGPYRVVGLLARGGMADVYRATDVRLGRDVALKVPSRASATDAQRVERFVQEARATASLDHPNIVRVYDVGLFGGGPYLVEELLDGETLRTRIGRASLSLDEARRVMQDVVRGLVAAHAAGLVHRDLKPENIFLTRAGGSKILDFGIAKLRQDVTRKEDAARGSGLSTLTGVLLGTAGYLAPEQIRGDAVDGRADLFAVGAITFEMLSGQRAFAGENTIDTLYAILHEVPADLLLKRDDLSAALVAIVMRLLEKAPEARFQSAADLLWALENADHLSPALETAAPARSADPGTPRRSSPNLADEQGGLGPLLRDARVRLFTIGLMAVTAGVTWLLTSNSEVNEPSRVEFVIELPPGARIEASNPALAFSPDGRELLYSAVVKGQNRLYARALDQVEATPVAGTEGAVTPFFAPDGQWLAFSSNTHLLKVSRNGGTPTALAVTDGRAVGASWGERGDIVFASQIRSGLSVVSAEAGTPRPLTTLESATGEASHRYPEFLPGGRAVIFTAGPPRDGAWYDSDIVAQALDTGLRHVLIRGAALAHYVPTGHLVYARAGTLLAVPFNPTTLSVGGSPVAVLKGVRESASVGVSQFAVSPNGTLAYVPGGLTTSEMLAIDRQGRTERLMTSHGPDIYHQPRLSPDGQRLALIIGRGDDNVWTYDSRLDVLSRLTSGANHMYEGWTPDGTRITFVRANSRQILWQPADRSGPEKVLVTTERIPVPTSWSPDGQLLVFAEANPATGFDVWTLDVRTRQKAPLLQTRFNEMSPMVSPDGRWLLYTSDETGRPEVFIESFPPGRRRWQVSRDGGTEPLWAPNGREVFFRQLNTLMAATIANGPPPAKPAALFNLPSWQANMTRTNYDVTPDGRHFIVARSSEAETAGTGIHIILDWAQELRRVTTR